MCRWAGSPNLRRSRAPSSSSPLTTRASSRRARSSSTAASPAPTSPRSEHVPLPLIGLSTYRERARWGVWDIEADVLPRSYADSVEAAGGVPVLLPPLDPTSARTVVARLDGLIITGGADVDPGQYDEPPHAKASGWRDDRDAWEIALLDAADSRGIPVLGICRGMQLM